MTEKVRLAGGAEVPRVCVDRLDELERVWPGATLPQARAAIALVVINALKEIQ